MEKALRLSDASAIKLSMLILKFAAEASESKAKELNSKQ